MASNEPEIFELGEIVRTIVPPRKIQKSDYSPEGTYPIVDQSVPAVAGWTEDKRALVHPKQDGLIVFGDHTCVLKFLTEPFAQGADGIKIIEVRSGFNAHYVFAHLTAFPLEQDGYKRHFSELKRLRVRIPNIRIQDAISGVLRILDSKIAANNAIVETLEQIAQMIFKSWFIDFRPVHTKSRGEQPEWMDPEIAELFPDSFEETELGLIPSGWRLARFDSFAEIQLGGTPSKARAEYWDGSIPWINSGAINEFRITKPSRYITELGLRKSSCKVLPKGTTVVAITGATLGQFSRVEIDTTANQSVIGIAPRNRCLNNFVYLWMTQNIEQLTSKATGGAQQHINRNDVCEQSVVLPSHEATSKFDELVDPIFAIISSLVHQNDTLVEIRDSLLPRLISGELEIPEGLSVD